LTPINERAPVSIFRGEPRGASLYSSSAFVKSCFLPCLLPVFLDAGRRCRGCIGCARLVRAGGASLASWLEPTHWLDGLGAALVKLVHRTRVGEAGRFLLAGSPLSHVDSRYTRTCRHGGAALDRTCRRQVPTRPPMVCPVPSIREEKSMVF
jgi:hypothetical protein